MKMTKQDLIYEVRDYFNITLGLMLYTLGFTVFLLPIHHIVEHQTFYKHGTQTKYHFAESKVDSSKRIYKQTAAYDAEVDHDKCFTERYVMEFVYYCCHNIRTASTTII